MIHIIAGWHRQPGRGGIKRIGQVTEYLVPFMALFYIVGALVIIVMNAGQLGEAFRAIFVGAFNPRAVGGGVLGATVKEAFRYGIARGVFSNEAGLGSTPHAHAVAEVAHPCLQGYTARKGRCPDQGRRMTCSGHCHQKAL